VVSSPDRSWKAGIFSMHEHNPVSTGYRCKEVSEGLLQTAVWQGMASPALISHCRGS